jgi:radical SAM protein with 4Fe4S-binding SPASM domain
MDKKQYVERKSFYDFKLWKNKGKVLDHLDLELTERCNNNCIHCYINQPENDLSIKQKELGTDKIKAILKEAADLGCLTVRFTGGEPLLRQDFTDLYLFTRHLGLKVIIFTNATLLNQDIVDLFARIPPLKKIQITLYGIKQKTYEAISRVPGSYAAAMRGINLLISNKIPFVVKTVFLPQNNEEINELEVWAQKKIPWMDRKTNMVINFDLRGRRDSEAKNRMLKSFRLTADEEIKLLCSKKNNYVKEMQRFFSSFSGPKGPRLFYCGAGRKSACIDAYGKVQVCMLLRYPKMTYDLSQGTLKEAMEIFFPKIFNKKAVNPQYLQRCAKCFLIDFCENCPAKAWMEHGAIDQPVEYYCNITHAQAVYLGILKDNEKAWEVRDWQDRIERFLCSEPEKKKKM